MNTYKIRVTYSTQRNYEQYILGNIKTCYPETAEAIAIGSLMLYEKEHKNRYLKIHDVEILEQC